MQALLAALQKREAKKPLDLDEAAARAEAQVTANADAAKVRQSSRMNLKKERYIDR